MNQMQPNQMGQGPTQPNPMRRRNPVWSVFVPPLVYWLISMIVQTCASMAYMLVNYGRVQEAVLSEDSSQMMQVVIELMKEILRFSTEITAVAAVIMLPIGILMMHGDTKKGFGTVGGIGVRYEKVPFLKYGYIVLFSVGACIALNNLIILSNIQSISMSYGQTMEALYATPLPLQLLCLGIIIPIVEEVIYRGLVYRRLRSSMSFGKAMIGSAMLFGIFHGNVVQLLYALLLGMALSYFYEKYGTLKAPIIAHCAMNIASVLITELHVFEWIFYSPLRMGAVTVGSVFVASVMFVLIRGIHAKVVMIPNEPKDQNQNLL